MSRGVAVAGLRFDRRELVDLLVAWLILALAVTILLERPLLEALIRGGVSEGAVDVLLATFTLSLLTVGVGFLLHELGHKVVAVHYDQVAAFRADYGMLLLALLFAMLEFLFAAPGAVHHRGRLTGRQRGLIALAGPLVNVALAGGFYLLALVGTGYLATVGAFGLFVNVILAAFNMIPFGPLDGRTVLSWSPIVFVAVFAPTAALSLELLGVVNLPVVGLPGL